MGTAAPLSAMTGSCQASLSSSMAPRVLSARSERRSMRQPLVLGMRHWAFLM